MQDQIDRPNLSRIVSGKRVDLKLAPMAVDAETRAANRVAMRTPAYQGHIHAVPRKHAAVIPAHRAGAHDCNFHLLLHNSLVLLTNT